MNIQELRQKYPQYEGVGDQELADALYKKYYSKIPREEFDARFLGTATPQQPQPQPASPEMEPNALTALQQRGAIKVAPESGDVYAQYQESPVRNVPEQLLIQPEQKPRSTMEQIGTGMLENMPAIAGTLGTAVGGPGIGAGAAMLGSLAQGAIKSQIPKEGAGLPGPESSSANPFIQMAGNTLEAAGQGALHLAGEAMGNPMITLAKKLSTPAFGMSSSGLDITKAFLKSKKLPIPPTLAGSGMGTAFEKTAEFGLGAPIVNVQRKKLTEGLSEAVQEMAARSGSRTIAEAGADTAQALASMGNMENTYGAYNQALKSLPQDALFEMPGIMDAARAIAKPGKETAEDIVKKRAIEAIKRTYSAKDAGRVKQTLFEILETGMANPKQLEVLGTDISRKAYGKSEYAAQRMKEGLMQDLELITTPGGENLGKVRKVADAIMHETYQWLEETGAITGLIYKKKKWEPTTKFEQLGPTVRKLFKEEYSPVTTRMKDYLIQNGMEDTWDGMKLAYLKDVFDSSIDAVGPAGKSVFKPGKFLKWYNENGRAALELMPEHADNINMWAAIAKNTMKQFEKNPTDFTTMAAKTGSVGGIGFMLGLPAWTVPTVFSPVAAALTMYPKVNILSKYANRTNIGPVGEAIAQTPGLMTKKLMMDYGPMGLKGINERLNRVKGDEANE